MPNMVFMLEVNKKVWEIRNKNLFDGEPFTNYWTNFIMRSRFHELFWNWSDLRTPKTRYFSVYRELHNELTQI